MQVPWQGPMESIAGWRGGNEKRIKYHYFACYWKRM